jgi:hypothetical protein
MAGNLTITISKKGAAIALSAAVFGAGTAVLVDELFFESGPSYSYASERQLDEPARSMSPNNQAESSAPVQRESQQEAVQSRITPSEAMRIAAAATGGTAVDVYPGFEAGRDVFYVDIRSGLSFREVYVDAITGEVIKIERGL